MDYVDGTTRVLTRLYKRRKSPRDALDLVVHLKLNSILLTSRRKI